MGQASDGAGKRRCRRAGLRGGQGLPTHRRPDHIAMPRFLGLGQLTLPFPQLTLPFPSHPFPLQGGTPRDGTPKPEGVPS